MIKLERHLKIRVTKAVDGSGKMDMLCATPEGRETVYRSRTIPEVRDMILQKAEIYALCYVLWIWDDSKYVEEVRSAALVGDDKADMIAEFGRCLDSVRFR